MKFHLPCFCSLLLAWTSQGFAQVDPCTQLPDTGPCEAAIPAWYFDLDWGQCTQFLWGGCEGTVPFETLEDCLASACPQEGLLEGLCDSIAISVVAVVEGSDGQIDIEVDANYVTPYWFAYAGFALFDADGSMVATEIGETAPNFYGFGGDEFPHIRHLEYVDGVDLSTWAPPFELELRLIEGWLAGGGSTRCTWTWYEFGNVNALGELEEIADPSTWASYDLLGRPTRPMPGQLLIQRSPDGRVRKVISE